MKSKKILKIILLMNVLEHIKNINNCFKSINDILDDDGILYGSTPFYFIFISHLMIITDTLSNF